MGRVAPRFVRLLLSDGVCEPVAPTQARECCVDLGASGFRDKLAEVLDTLVDAHVIVQRGELDKLAHEGDSAIDAHIFMTDDGFGDSLCLIMTGTEDLQHLHGLDSAIDVKGHPCSLEVRFSSADIVKQTAQSPSGRRQFCDMLREELLCNDISYFVNLSAMLVDEYSWKLKRTPIEDSHRVIEGFRR